jgi:CubicO group peptidase (beta-lactamase class C family)
MLLMMKARDAGLISLDDPITKHMPDFKINTPFPSKRGITFHQLATHLAGNRHGYSDISRSS